MLPIRTLLHPTDFSEHSEYAFRLACSLARDYGAKVLLLHVAEPAGIIYADGPMAYPDEGCRANLRQRLEQLQPQDAKVRLERRLVEGNPGPEILRIAGETNCELIVMGTHGRTGLRRLLMGSVAEYVMRKAPCPVLTVKSPFPQASPAGEMISRGAERPLDASKT